MSEHYLPEGMPRPHIDSEGLSEPFWNGLREHRLMVQQCNDCGVFQFGPEWLCHGCRSFSVSWKQVPARGTIYSWERVWHPVHPALKDRGAYLVVLVELDDAAGVRMVGNLLGNAMQDVSIGTRVEGVFEDHDDEPAYTLLQWRLSYS